jgi:hypothetical protein
MILGPDQIVACPHCGALAKYMTLLSGNTFGARVWTDGKRLAPMLPAPPAVVKCHHCGDCYWLADAEEVGAVELWPGGHLLARVFTLPVLRALGTVKLWPGAEWAAAPVIEEPAEADYYDALERGLATNSEQERTLRILAWWRRNDAFRHDAQAEAGRALSLSDTCRTNLEALATTLDEADERDRLMKAEVLRQLGEFEAAKTLLRRVTSAEYGAFVRQLRLAADAEDPGVRELQLSSSPDG